MRLSVPLRARIEPDLLSSLRDVRTAMLRTLPLGASEPSLAEVVRLALWAGVDVLRTAYGLGATPNRGTAT